MCVCIYIFCIKGLRVTYHFYFYVGTTLAMFWSCLTNTYVIKETHCPKFNRSTFYEMLLRSSVLICLIK